ncbi:MAG TPA: phosphatase PAP2 family protein [Solirubrobacteraceae bacterium]|nr:phosphatase PAP2 family protein [Solirubrobacteraceae bacterium]
MIPLIAGSAPIGLSVAMRRSRARDVGVCALQMWAYVSAYKTPHDDAEAQAARVHVAYPIWMDRVLGLGVTPTLRLQRALGRPGVISPLDKVLVWAHWMWFAVPHGAVAYLLFRRPEQFERGATMMYATFDLGAIAYHLAPTAPPWYAAAEGHVTSEAPARRMMAEYGEQFWRDRWGPLYSVLGGNPLAAMPSLHFATSVMAARLLSDAGPVAGALGWTYAGVLGFALVYIGEHYVVDLLGGWALTEAVLRYGDRAAPLLSRLSRAIGWLGDQAHADR